MYHISQPLGQFLEKLEIRLLFYFPSLMSMPTEYIFHSVFRSCIAFLAWRSRWVKTYCTSVGLFEFIGKEIGKVGGNCCHCPPHTFSAIDKRSSAELSEAINSMYTWYANAEVCYAYLSDVSESAAIDGAGSECARSRWFTRGWTLQELIAPRSMVFYSANWTKIGEKSNSISPLLSTTTGIDADILTGDRELETASVAKRMSWAARRTTTRTEDLAYSLMGIFSVNMPMLYGEGAKAFISLQEEIMKASDDETLFA